LLNREDHWCFARERDAFAPQLVNATIAVEDQRFAKHPGVDPVAVVRAMGQNILGRRVVSGASTLTMQTVKLATGIDGGLGQKARQAWLALRLDRHAGKEAVLTAYLNRAPYGRNLTGAEAAARRYFGKPAKELTLPEAALIAGLPKAPGRYDPIDYPERARVRRDHVLARMRDEGMITADQYDRAAGTPITARWHDLPDLAPHLAAQLAGELRAKGRITLTLDAALQHRVREVVRAALPPFEGQVTNAAAMIIDVASGEVRVRIGGADFLNTPGGQVDLCAAPRSPGSTLKPFAYGAALEAGVLYPSEVLLDANLDFGLYRPGNFDGEFQGRLTAAQALAHSLNVPAVCVLQRVGASALLNLLRDAGLTTLSPGEDRYGLGLTLGNCEARMDQIAAAYAALARLGEYRPLRLRADEPPAVPDRILSAGTCAELIHMLEQPLPRELRDGFVHARGAPARVCWKTGTSTGYHDAWTFLFDRRYVVAVWLGNSGGKPSKRLVGGTAALPLAARIYRLLPNTAPPALESREHLRTVDVCAHSGLPLSAWCPASKKAYMAQQHYLNRRCDVHRPARDGAVTAVWPGSPMTWDLARVRVTLQEETTPVQRALHIETPAHRGVYVLTGEEDGDTIALQAKAGGGPVHWYMNGAFVGTAATGSPLIWPLEAGSHLAACLTPAGESATAQFEVVHPSGPDRTFKP
jgi:penicillin-binding protein 1C